MKQQILQYINSHQLLYLRRKELVGILLQVFVGADVGKIIDELLAEGDLYLDHSNKICSSASKGYIKGKIIGIGAQRKLFTTGINGICAKINGCL